MQHFLFILFCFVFSKESFAQSKTYFISTLGNDSNNGLSTSTAWRSISKINQIDLNAGDSVLFRGGQIYKGTILLNKEDVGIKSNPIVISSYDTGRATINGSEGISAHNAGGIKIQDLIIKGDSRDLNEGVYFLIDQKDTDIDYVLLKDIEVYGFGGAGIEIRADSTDKGFNDFSIINCIVRDNGHAGIETFGFWPQYSHSNFYIGYCKVYNNLGTFATANHSGSGIAVSGVDGAIVEYCEAYNNGANNRGAAGGPIGIWTYNAKNVIIQFCESHHNKAGLLKDGGGFDIDGGSQNCIIQYCYSHDNEGAGFGMFEFGSPNKFTGNIIRYNISQNDGRKNSFGALGFWAIDTEHSLNDSWVYNNTIYMDATNIVNGQPAAIDVLWGNLKGIHVVNNIFYTTAGIPLLKSSEPLSTSAIHFKNNNYYSTAAPVFLWGSNNYFSLSAWKTAAPGQEKNGTVSLGLSMDPFLSDPGGGERVGVADGKKLASVTAYKLKSNSAMINAGLDITNNGNKDYYGMPVPDNIKTDIGAAEFDSISKSTSGILEAELALLNKTVIDSNHAGYTGTGFADFINKSSDYIEWKLDKATAGSTSLRFRYANGSNIDRPLKLEVNGQVLAASIPFTPTGEWTNWSASTITTNLLSGINKIRLTTIGYSGANIDHLAWSEVALSSGILEAELALLSNEIVIDSNHSGYTGIGFTNYINETGDYVEWTLNKPNAGSASLKFRYANGSSTNRPLKLEINGQVVTSSLSFLPTGSWSTWSYTGITANLLFGINKIRITAIGYSGANIDHLAWSEIASAAQNISSQAQTVLATGLKVAVLPNPVVGIAKLFLSTSTDGPVEIMLVDMVGKVHKRLFYKNIGTNHFNLPVNDLPSGLYILYATQGAENAFTRFVVNK
jgi:hypothetical protein